MATSHHPARQRQERERVLARLERKLDRSHDHLREHNADRADIHRLLNEGVIDRGHAEMLLDASSERYERATESKDVKRCREQAQARLKHNTDIARIIVLALVAGFLIWLYLF